MNHLVFLIISIVLMSSMTGLAIKYVPSDAYQKQQTYQSLMQGYGSLHESTVRYLQANRDQGLLPYPGDGVEIQSIVTPAYGFLPVEVAKELTWQVAGGVVYGQEAIGICAKPISAEGVSERTQKAMELVQAQMPQASTFIGSDCNATDNVVGGDHMTYWVILSHLD